MLNSTIGIDHDSRRLSPGSILILATLALIVVQLLLQPRFGTYQNLTNLLRMTSVLALISVGQMLVIIVRGFDLSIGAMMAAASIVVASTLGRFGSADYYLPTALLAVAVAIGFGVVVGTVNGLIITKLRVHAFIVTLGTSSVITGIALWFTNGVPVYGMPKPFIDGFGRSTWWGIPSFVWVVAVSVLFIALLFDRTVAGAYIKAAGRNERAAQLSGIATGAYVTLAYAICGACAAVGSLLLTAQIGSGQATIGTIYTFQGIAVCIIGGVSLMGGKGAVLNVVLAALFLQLLTNGFELWRISSQVQAIFTGAIVIAVALAQFGKKD